MYVNVRTLCSSYFYCYYVFVSSNDFRHFILIIIYSLPDNIVHHSTVSYSRLVDPTACCLGVIPPTRTRKVSAPAINELKTYARIYPTERTELQLGFLVNSFAGPD